jgi:hypothetical protein
LLLLWLTGAAAVRGMAVSAAAKAEELFVVTVVIVRLVDAGKS